MDGGRRLKKTAQSWRVPSGISALGDRTTFMPARKKSAPGGCHKMESKIMKTQTEVKDAQAGQTDEPLARWGGPS
jgi:hypothetical protein